MMIQKPIADTLTHTRIYTCTGSLDHFCIWIKKWQLQLMWNNDSWNKGENSTSAKREDASEY